MVCWKCKKELNISEVFRTTECSECGCDLHCCKQCVFFAPGCHYDCKENIDSFVSDKEKANFCDFFRLNNNIKFNEKTTNNARSAAAALFGDSTICNDDRKNYADALNALFG